MNEQIDLFSNILPKYKITKPIRLIEMFAGIGSQAKALKKLGVEFEHWKVLEIDKYAIASYNAIHGTNFTPQDITQTHAQDLEIGQRESYTYILTYSFPCQDLSLAGKGKGMSKGNNTRSGLLWEVERILDECDGNLPDVLLMENVPQVIGKKNIKDFQLWRRKLESLGYSNYVQLLNAKNYGIPQNRNRCFMVSILGQYHYEFPKKIPLKLKLKDMLEDEVDEKYYLSDAMIEYIVSTDDKYKVNPNNVVLNRDIACSKTSREGNTRADTTDYISEDLPDNYTIKKLGNYSPSGHNASSVVDKNGLAPTVMENHGTITAICEGGVAIKNNNSKGYLIAKVGDGIDISSRQNHHRGTVQKEMSQTIDTQCNVGVIDGRK